MRTRAYCYLAAALLCAAAAATRAEEATQTEKIALSFSKPDQIMQLFAQKAGLPKGIGGIIGYPLDNSLLVSGSPDALQALKSAVALGDVKVESDDGVKTTTLSFRKTKPEQVKQLLEAIHKLADAGSAVTESNRLLLRGKEKWLNDVIAAAMRVEMLASGVEIVPPLHPGVFAAIQKEGETSAPWMTITVPSGVKVGASSEKAQYNTEEGAAYLTGVIKVTIAEFKLEVNGRVRIASGKNGEPTVVQVLQSEAPAKIILPNSTDVKFEGATVRYSIDEQKLEATGPLTLVLPKGITAVIPNGKAISSPLRKGEPLELSISPGEVAKGKAT